MEYGPLRTSETACADGERLLKVVFGFQTENYAIAYNVTCKLVVVCKTFETPSWRQRILSRIVETTTSRHLGESYLKSFCIHSV